MIMKMEEYVMKNNSSVIQNYNFNQPLSSQQGTHPSTKFLMQDEESRSKKVS